MVIVYIGVLCMEMKKGKSIREEVSALSTAIKLRENEKRYLRDMERYIKRLEDEQVKSKESAYREAQEALIRTGVMDKDGKMKKKIVSWE